MLESIVLTISGPNGEQETSGEGYPRGHSLPSVCARTRDAVPIYGKLTSTRNVILVEFLPPFLALHPPIDSEPLRAYPRNPVALRYTSELGLRMFVVVWQFEIAEDKMAGFEAAYGPDGAWAQLFRTSPNYLGTELLRDAYVPGAISPSTAGPAKRIFAPSARSTTGIRSAGPRLRRPHQPRNARWRVYGLSAIARYSSTRRFWLNSGPAIVFDAFVESDQHAVLFDCQAEAGKRPSPADGRRSASANGAVKVVQLSVIGQ